MKDQIVMILAGGLVFLLIMIVGADFIVSYLENKPPDENVIGLLQNSIVAIAAIVAGHIAGKAKD